MLVALVAPVGAHSLEISGPSDVFEEANRQCATERAYEVRVISEGPGPITAASGLRILPDRTIHDPDEPIDTLVVVGPYGIPAPPSRALVAWLGRRAATARRYGSVCTGAFLLGAAGLLGGRRVATRWRYAPELAAAYPSAIVEPDRIFVRDGPLFSSAGVTAGIDLALALVEEDLGGAVALAVARQLVMFLKRPGGQSQFSVQLAAQTATRSPIQQVQQVQQVQQWVRDNPGADLSIAALSRRAAMSGRNFARVFRRETGVTPADFVEATRVDAARRMLEEGGLPFQRIASECGFTGSEALRRAFLRRLAVTPRDYRSRFRSDPERPGRGGHPGRPAPVGVG